MRWIQHQRQAGLPPQIPGTAGIAGQAWSQQWLPPFFPRRMPSFEQQTQIYTPVSPGLLSTIQGIAWRYPFDQPRPKRTPFFLHQSSPAFGTTFALPVPISGIAWWRPFDQPYQVKVKASLQQTDLRLLIATSAGISGMAWWRPFDQPKQVRVETVKQQTQFHVVRYFWAGELRQYISGGAR